jgi:hypothetical protein
MNFQFSTIFGYLWWVNHFLSCFIHIFPPFLVGQRWQPTPSSQEMGFPASAVRRTASAAEAAEDAVSGGGVRVYLLPGGIGQVQRYPLVNIQKTMEITIFNG